MTKKVCFILLAVLFIFTCCCTNQSNANLINPTNRNIKSISISYHDWEKLENHRERLEELKDTEHYWEYSDLLDEYINSEEYFADFITIDVNREHWERIISELRKPKRKEKGSLLRFLGNPGREIGSITILYNDGRETQVGLAEASFFMNGERYEYGHGPDFGFIQEIIKQGTDNENN